MKIAVQGIFNTDLRDINYESVRFVIEMGFQGLCTHINVPAESIPATVIAKARDTIAGQGLAYLQLWGKYPCIITPDESVRKAGVAQLREMCKLTAKLGVPAVGVRPTSMNPRGDWWPHPDNYKPEAEDRLVQSLNEMLTTCRDLGLYVVLETHQTSTLDTPKTIRRVIERTDPKLVRVNLDLCNFVTDIRTAFNPAPMIHEQFDVLGEYVDTVHVKDYYLEDRLAVHVAETVLGTGLMDWHTLLSRARQNQPDGWLTIEHLPVSMIPIAKANLDQKLKHL
jgi:sugar phosphate isomerase/epimerase